MPKKTLKKKKRKEKRTVLCIMKNNSTRFCACLCKQQGSTTQWNKGNSNYLIIHNKSIILHIAVYCFCLSLKYCSMTLHAIMCVYKMVENIFFLYVFLVWRLISNVVTPRFLYLLVDIILQTVSWFCYQVRLHCTATRIHQG